MNFSDKEFITQLKLLFSSLFARAMTKVVIGCPGLKENEFIFSNIKLDEIRMYETDPEHFIHRVEVLDTQFLNDLFEIFPFFKNTCCLLYTDKFLSTIGKHTGKINDIKTFINDKNIDLCVTTENNTPLIVTCAEIISEHDANEYKRVFDLCLIDNINSKEQDIKNSISEKDPFSLIDIVFDNDNTYRFVHPMKGFVSIKEYPSKALLMEYSYKAKFIKDKRSIKINTQFRSPSVNVTSVQPASVWFIKPKNKESKNG